MFILNAAEMSKDTAALLFPFQNTKRHADIKRLSFTLILFMCRLLRNVTII